MEATNLYNSVRQLQLSGSSPIMTSNKIPKFTVEAVSYGETTGEKETIPVIDDSKYQGEGMDTVDSRTADSNKQLGNFEWSWDKLRAEQDEKEALDKKNILPGDRLRHVKASYKEKEEDDLPARAEDTGRSNMVGKDAYRNDLR